MKTWNRWAMITRRGGLFEVVSNKTKAQSLVFADGDRIARVEVREVTKKKGKRR